MFLRSNSFLRLFLRQTNACIPGSVVQCGIRCRFHQQKKWCFGCRSCCQTLSSRGWLRISLVPIVLHVLHIFQIGQRRGVLRVSMLFSKGVQLQPDEWPWNGEGTLGAKGMCGVRFFPKARLDGNLTKNN